MKKHTRSSSVRRGFGLIEVLIAVLVVGMLAGFALPGYRQHFIRVHRSEARQELLRTAQQLEMCFARYGVYNHADCAAAQRLPHTIGDGRYQVAAPRLTGDEYRLTATPQQSQSDDRDCGTFVYSSNSVKSVAAGAIRPSSYCWSH
jgi:type IV pilus assembly protein PilE